MPEINEYGQQVNDLVPGWQGAQVLRRTALNGRFCRLEPLDVDRHAADLFAAYALGDNSDWTWRRLRGRRAWRRPPTGSRAR